MSEKKQSVCFALVFLGILILGASEAQRVPQLIPQAGSTGVDSILVNPLKCIAVAEIDDDLVVRRGDNGTQSIPGQVAAIRDLIQLNPGSNRIHNASAIQYSLIPCIQIVESVDPISVRISQIPIDIPAIRAFAGATRIETIGVTDVTVLPGALIGLGKARNVFSA